LSYTLSTSLKATSAMDPPDVECGAVGGEDALLGVCAVERLECRKRSGDGLVCGTGSEHAQALVLRLAQEGDRVGRDVHEAKAPTREGGERAAKPAQRAHLVQKRLVPPFAPRHRAPCVFAPRALDAELVAGEEHRHAG